MNFDPQFCNNSLDFPLFHSGQSVLEAHKIFLVKGVVKM